MDIIPLTAIHNKKIQNFNLLEKLKEDTLLYLIDLDGIEKDKSNLDIYQKLSKKYQLWIDNTPRKLGDIVDVFMSGAANITLRKTFYSNIKIEKIREITENKIYANIEINNQTDAYTYSFFKKFDGLINFYTREEIEYDFKKEKVIKNILAKNKIYIYENNKKNIEYWNKFSPFGFLVDLSKYWEFTKI